MNSHFFLGDVLQISLSDSHEVKGGLWLDASPGLSGLREVVLSVVHRASSGRHLCSRNRVMPAIGLNSAQKNVYRRSHSLSFLVSVCKYLSS